jgi:hypothetical protein
MRTTAGSAADSPEELRVLGFLVGEYTASAEFRTGPTTWDSTTATVTITRDLDGCVLREHFRGTRYGAPYESLATWFLTQRIRYARRAAGT